MSVLGLNHLHFSSLFSVFESCLNRCYIPLTFEISLLFAVPKQKVTHSRKRMRMATKQLRNLQNITKCPKCGQPKLLHNLCWKCYGDYKKLVKNWINTTIYLLFKYKKITYLVIMGIWEDSPTNSPSRIGSKCRTFKDHEICNWLLIDFIFKFNSYLINFYCLWYLHLDRQNLNNTGHFD